MLTIEIAYYHFAYGITAMSFGTYRFIGTQLEWESRKYLLHPLLNEVELLLQLNKIISPYLN